MAAKTRYCREITIFLSDWFRERAVFSEKMFRSFLGSLLNHLLISLSK